MVLDNATPAQRLALAADRHGLWPVDAARFEDIRTEFNLALEELTPNVIEQAHRLNRNAIADLRNRLARHVAEDSGQTKSAYVERIEKKVSKQVERKKLGGQVKIFGHSIVSVLRWMGKNGWNWEDAALAVETISKRSIATPTIKTQVNAGKHGQRGDVAPITPSQAKKLLEAAK